MSRYSTIREIVLRHLKDADKNNAGDAANPGPTPGEAYKAAHATVVGAYAGGGITAAQWSDLDAEIRSHRDTAR